MPVAEAAGVLEVPWDEKMRHVLAAEDWLPFTFTYKRIKAGQAPNGAIEATCPFHRKNAQTTCKKSLNIVGREDADVELTLRTLKHWCNQARMHQRQRDHIYSQRRLDPGMTPPMATVAANRIFEPPDGPVLDDIALDARAGCALLDPDHLSPRLETQPCQMGRGLSEGRGCQEEGCLGLPGVFPGISGTAIYLGNAGKDGINLNSQTWPGTPRRPSPRHPRKPQRSVGGVLSAEVSKCKRACLAYCFECAQKRMAPKRERLGCLRVSLSLCLCFCFCAVARFRCCVCGAPPVQKVLLCIWRKFLL